MQRPVWQRRRWLVIGLTVAGIVWTVAAGGFTAFEHSEGRVESGATQLWLPPLAGPTTGSGGGG